MSLGYRVPSVTIYRFDESSVHREIRPYDPIYRIVFVRVRDYVRAQIDAVELVHIGSTAIPDLRGKPMLDIVAITPHEDLRTVQKDFERLGFHRRDVWVDRDDKPYVCGSIKIEAQTYNINIHICHRNDPVHRDSVVFMEILGRRPDLRRKYEEAKDRAHSKDPINAEAYNREKEWVIREVHGALESSVRGR